MRRVLLSTGLAVLVLLVLAPGGLGRETTRREVRLGCGRPWATRYWVHTAPAEGPTVMIIGGVHGDEPGGAYAADQIRHWPLRRGRLVVLPRANVRALAAKERLTPGISKALDNLNRNYPDATADSGEASRPRGEVAKAIWSLLKKFEPAWLLDLHEGGAPHIVSPKRFARTVIAHPDQADALEAADRMVAAANGSLPKEAPKFVRLVQVTRTTLARSAADNLGVRALTLETCYAKQPLSRRARRHRIMVHTLLLQLGMIDASVGIERVLPERRSRRETRVALYDAEGTGGPGVPRVLAQLRNVKHVTVVRLGPEDIRDGALAAFDVCTFTGGSGSRQAKALAAAGRKAVDTFIEAGGGYIGICAGAYLVTAAFSWSVPVLDAKPVSSRWKRGRGMVDMEWSASGRRIFAGARGRVPVRYGNGPIIEPLARDDIEDYEVLAWFRSELAKNGSPKGAMKGSPAIAWGRYGKGRVLWVSPHPEQTPGLEAFVPRAVKWVRRR